MKISNIKNPKEFFEVLNDCKGTINLVTDDGDILNLKSKLCRYIAMSQFFKDPEIKHIEIMFSEPDDINLVIDFLVRG